MARFIHFCGYLILAAVIIAVSAVTLPHLLHEAEQPAVEPVSTPEPIIISGEPVGAVIEYGIPEVIKHNNDPIHAYIRFPQGGHLTDEEILNWAQGIYDDFNAGFLSELAIDPSALGEINIQFDSFLVDNRYAGILENGEYTYFSLNPEIPPIPVVKTFNIELTSNTFLEPTDILDYSQANSIIFPLLYNRMVAEHPQTESHLAFIDETWLNHLVIGHEGVIVVLEKNVQLPEAFDTLAVTLPYNDLDSALLIRTEDPLAAPPTPEPTPEPEQTPHPTPEPIIEEDEDEDEDGEDGDDEDGDEEDEDDEDAEEEEEQEHHDGSTSDASPQSNNIDPTKPIIALSFDDGPGVYTDKFVELLEKYNVRATFCTIGNLVQTQPDALKRAVEAGNEVIGHSWDHKNLAKLSAEDVKKQLTNTSNVIHTVTGTRIHKFRPPYGAVSDTMKEVAEELGYAIIYWSVDPEDWNTKDSDAVYNSVMQQVKNGSIILSHEIYKSTLVAYERIIPELLSRGYQIVTVSELLELKYGDLTPGHIYYDGYER